MHFEKKYFFAALLFFVLEVLIAAFVKDKFLRPYGGDLLVVIFLYCLARSFLKVPVKTAIFGVLLFCFLIEGLQHLQIVERMDLADNSLVYIILGSHFEWLDILFYVIGALLLLLVEKRRDVL